MLIHSRAHENRLTAWVKSNLNLGDNMLVPAVALEENVSCLEGDVGQELGTVLRVLCEVLREDELQVGLEATSSTICTWDEARR